MSKKDYIAFANIVRQVRAKNYPGCEVNSTAFVARMAEYFESQNPSFDRDKWIRECYTPLVS